MTELQQAKEELRLVRLTLQTIVTERDQLGRFIDKLNAAHKAELTAVRKEVKTMSAKKGDAQRFAEFVAKIGIDQAQSLLDIMKGYQTGKSKQAGKVAAAATKPRSNAATATTEQQRG